MSVCDLLVTDLLNISLLEYVAIVIFTKWKCPGSKS